MGLHEKLKRSLKEFREKAEVLRNCRELRENLDLLLKDDVTELKTMVELGCQFYAKAFVPDTSRIFVDVGLGFHLEMPLEEAAEFMIHKEKHVVDVLEVR